MDQINQVYAVIGGNPWEGEDFKTLKLFKTEKDALAYADQLRDTNDYEFVYEKLIGIN